MKEKQNALRAQTTGNGKQKTGRPAGGSRTAQRQSRRVINPHSRLPHPKSLWTLSFSLAVLPLLARAGRVYRDIPQLPAHAHASRLPSLSIIVPARNEAHNLGCLLPSLLAQDYPGELEIIVVDDHSTDGTGDAVRRRMTATGERNGRAASSPNNIRLIAAPELPDGWLGKPNASHSGAAAARGDYLLFTDADTVHDAKSAASAVAFAEAYGLDGLSIFLHQETLGLIDSTVLMVAFAGLFSGLRRSTTMLNGQYILLRREVYERSGGFAAVRAEMMDDLAYGRLLAEKGYQVPMMRGESLAGVHMYADRRQMWRGITRIGSGSLRFSGAASLLPAIFVSGLMMPLWALLFNRRSVREIPSLWLVWLTAMLGFLPWSKRLNNQQAARNIEQETECPAGAGDSHLKTVLRVLLVPPAAVFTQLASAWGLLSRMLGLGVSWKNRKV